MCHSVQLLRISKIRKSQEFMENWGKTVRKGGNEEVLILNSYEKTRKFEKALSFTHCTCLNVWKKCPCVIWKFSCVSRLKNGSLGSFRGLGLRPRPQKEPRQPFFIISKPSGKKSNYTWKNFLHPSIEQSVKESTIHSRVVTKHMCIADSC